MHTDAAPHLFWITSRAAGSAAMVLASLAVCLGLLMSTRRLKRISGADLRTIHEAMSIATMAAIGVHAFALIGDSFLHPTLLDVLVPFASSYKTFWTSTGIVAGWALVLLGLSYYARGRIGVRRWEKAHRFTALAWLGGLVHTLGEGTDAGQGWFLAMIFLATAPALALLIWRMTPLSHPARAQSAVR